MMEWISEPLNAEHDLSSFSCGQESLDEWLKTTALRAQQADTGRTYVWTSGNTRVVAYYSVAPTQIRREGLSRRQTGGFTVVPAYLLARLALDKSLHGQGLGSELLIDALETIVAASKRSGGRLIVVDAVDDAAVAFYRHHNFEPIGGDDLKLVMKVATARQALAVVSMSVTSDEDTRLTSLVLEMPDGTLVPVVMSATEAQAVAGKIAAAADETLEKGEVTLNFRQVLEDVLGRDPFGV